MNDLFDEKSVYTVGEVASVLRVSPVTVIRAIRKGRLKALRVEGQWRIPGGAAMRYLYLETKASLARQQSRIPH